MQWIILIGDQNFNIDTIKSIVHYESTDCYEVSNIKNRYCIDYGQDHIFYDYLGDSTEDYEDGSLSAIPFKHPHFIMMSYTLVDRMREVLKQDNFIKEIYIDNDHGLITSIQKFVELGMPVDY